MDNYKEFISKELYEKFKLYNYNNAMEILINAYPDEWKELCSRLKRLNYRDVCFSIDKEMSEYGWRGTTISADAHIHLSSIDEDNVFSRDFEEQIVEDLIPAESFDAYKNGVAVKNCNILEDFSVSSIANIKSLYECGAINVCVAVPQKSKNCFNCEIIGLPLVIVEPLENYKG